MIYATIAFLAATAGQVAAAGSGVWCAELGQQTTESKSLQDVPGISYRGKFKDFSLFIERSDNDIANCEVFAEHYVGDDGLWVIEEPTSEALEKTKSDILAAGEKVYYEHGLSMVAGGGTLLPNITGLDGCGAAQDTAIIPVPSHSVKPQILTDTQMRRWVTERKSGLQSNEDIQKTVDSVSKDALVDTVTTLQTINSRNSYSETLYDAEKFVVQRFEELGFTISYHEYSPNIAPNVIATWGPTSDKDDFVVAGAHLDSRSEDSTSGSDRAPGMFCYCL